MDSLGQFKDFFRGRIDKGAITDIVARTSRAYAAGYRFHQREVR